MTGIVLSSHGGLAEGVLNSANMVFGSQEELVAVTLTPEDSPGSFRDKLEEGVGKLSDQSQVLFLVDLLGGTPFNQASSLLEGHEDSWAILTGLSLPMLIAALSERMMDEEISAHDLAKAVLVQAREAVTAMPESLDAETQAPAPANEENTECIPEGTVLGDGHIKYVLARVDSRLLHGQVATGWTKSVQPDRIIVVSDSVSKDELRKSLIVKAAPPGVKAHVVPLKKIIEVDKDPRFGDTKALLLFENPEDALKVIEAGVSIKTINIGSMAHSVGKVQVNKVISMDRDNIETFKKLKQLGIGFDVRKVPTDSGADIDELLSKAERALS